MESSDLLVLCQKWPEISAKELVEYYNEIKQNKKLNITDLWTNPGRIDPVQYASTKNEKLNEIENQNCCEIKIETVENQNLSLQNQNNGGINSKFNICDEFLNEDKEDQDNNEIFKIENAALISNKIRRDTNTKKF